MLNPIKVLPRVPPSPNERAPQENIPQTQDERRAIQAFARQFADESGLVPPIPFSQLRETSVELVEKYGIDPKYRDFAAVLLNNELWREQLATVPYERRLLLLPKCLRVEAHCPAPFDEFGLLCKKCGHCSIQDLQEEAERLGYAVLVAEGSPIVMAIIETGKIDAIVGVSCLSVLERAFPYMEAAAIPGIALPLLQDDCLDTNVDLDQVWDIIHLTGADKTRRMDLSTLRDDVDTSFTPESLADVLGEPSGETERIAQEWLSRAGKRWRPFLTAAVYQAFQAEPGAALPADLRKVAVAVECFHKASLIHDDIEDDDSARYGEKTLHEEYGVPVALNVGDYLLGEGYRLIGECDVDAEQRVAMLQVAAAGHRRLSLGQGAELCWAREPQPLDSLQVLDIFRQKTAPAFEVALRLGAIYAGRDHEVDEVLQRFSEALGIAYQIRDDVQDLDEGDDPSDILANRPTLPMAIAHERAKGDAKATLDAFWRRSASGAAEERAAQLRELLVDLDVRTRTHELCEAYKEEAIRSLWTLENPNLKGLLRRVIGKIFNETEIKGWCNEFEARNAAGSEVGAQSAGRSD